MKIFFRPGSIAVIGASERKNSLGEQIITNLLYGFQEKIYPVNPNYSSIRGIPCFPSVETIPDPVDLAIIIVPAAAVPQALEACGRKAIHRVIIESAGFSEVGAEGRALQERCTAIASAAGIRVWGPNCMGLVDVPRRHLFTFMHPKVYEDGLIPGRISLIVQSGMLSAGFMADLMSERAIGVGKACSIGNKSDVDECDVLEYLLEDDETDAVALYLESIPRGRRFMELAHRTKKPIVVLKGGKSFAGARAALSHTSSLAGNARLQDSLFGLAGVTVAHDFQQMMEMAQALAMIPDTPSLCRTAVMTFSGGAGILSCDLLEEQGLVIAELTPETKKELGAIFPDWLPASNPVDLFPAFGAKGPLAAYQGAFAALLKDPGVDVIFMHYFAGLHTGLDGIRSMKEAARRAGKVLIVWVIGLRQAVRPFKQKCQEYGLPVYGELSRAVECLAAASRYQPRRTGAGELSLRGPCVPQSARELLAEGKGMPVWDEFDSKRLLERCGIAVAEERLVRSVEEALETAQAIGYPLVVKGLLPGEVHKTESGLVMLGITSPASLRQACEAFMARMQGRGRILVQRQIPIDYELIAGFLRDGQFGPCVMFGLGGIFSELQRDVVFALAPLTKSEAVALLGRIKGRKLLEGFRGMAPLDEDAMADILVRLGSLGAACPQIEQIDMNPLVVSKGRPVAVDATVILGKGDGSDPSACR
jgi:acetyltransferase